MQVYFIRHAQSVNNAIWENEEFYEGGRKADPPLTETGLQQALMTAEFLAQTHPELPLRWVDPQNTRGFGLTHLYCSLMERAVQTGTIISERLGITLVADRDLHEIGGIYIKEMIGEEEVIQILHGHNRRYFEMHFPDLILPDAVDNQGWWPGGREAREDRAARAERILAFLKSRHYGTNDKIGVIMHGGIYRQIFRVLFHIDLDVPYDLGLSYRVILNNCSITRIDFEENEFLLMYQNRVDHLPAELIT